MIRLREKYPPRPEGRQEGQEEQEQEPKEALLEQRRRERRFTEKEALEKVEDLQEKERLRMERLNMLKIKVIEDHSKEFRCKPYLRKENDELWNRCKLRKQLSSSVFERFDQYEMRRKSKLERTERRVREETTPFAPRISDHSRLLASRSSSKSPLQRGLSRSLSCKCINASRTRKLASSTAMHSSRRS